MRLITRRSFLALLSFFPLAVDANKSPALRQLFLQNPIWHLYWQDLINEVIGPYSSVVKIGQASQESLQPIKKTQWSEGFIKQISNAGYKIGNEEILNFRGNYRDRLRQDFQESRTVQVNGYILSRTEVEICRWVATTIDINSEAKKRPTSSDTGLFFL